jgi:hypothetical protein
MSFDARSLERLRQLGRSLPERLPPPQPPAASPTPAPGPSPPAQGQPARRHRLETETDPEALFHALVQASADGSAPPHLLERLRELEASRQGNTAAAADAGARGSGSPDLDLQARPGPRSRQGRRQRERGRPDPKLAADHGDLYTAFAMLLLEDDEI